MRVVRLLVLLVLVGLAVSVAGAGATTPSGTIAFTCGGGICTIAADGSNLTTIATGPAVDPAWSPDGKQLAFVSDRDGEEAIYVMDADGGNVRRLTPQGLRALEPAWSRDGRIAFLAFPDETAWSSGIFVVNADGTGLHQVLDDALERYGTDPAWSPDGSRIAFTGSVRATPVDPNPKDGIYLMQTDGTDIRRLVTGDAPAWSPDGTHLAFLALDATNHQQLAVSASDGTDIKPIATVDNCGISSAPAWSPNSAWLAYLTCPTATAQLYLVPAAGGTPTRLAFNGGPVGVDWRPVIPSTGLVLSVRFAQRACSSRPGKATITVTDAQARPLAAVPITLRGGTRIRATRVSTNTAGKAITTLRTTPGKHRGGRLYLAATAAPKDRPAVTRKLSLPACT